MNLTVLQAIKILKEPKNTREIKRAKEKKLRHKLHTEPETDELCLGREHETFLSRIARILNNKENYDRFRQLYSVPIYTNELTESIFSQFERVFNAEDSFETINFKSPELKDDFNNYRSKIGDFQFWPTQGFEAFKTSIDSILIVDLPNSDIEVMPDVRPDPYYYLLDIECVIDIENSRVDAIDHTNNESFFFFKTEYIAFKGKGGVYHVFDDTYYRSFTEEGGEYTLSVENAHNLGFCPARSFWTTPLNSETTIRKRNPITNSLSEFDWLLFFSLSQKYLELYAPFPIIAVYKGKCDYREEGRAKGKCVDGYIEYEGVVYNENSERKRCPRCANRLKTGPGNIMELKIPKDKEDPDLMANPVKIIGAETTSLEYVKTRIREKWNELYENCVGRGTDTENDQAKNELQIQAGFESKTSVLMKIKKNFEIINSFALDTMARLRYGDQYVGLTKNYGETFFAKDEKDQVEELQKAKDIGAPAYEVATRRNEIWETKYKNNPEMLERVKTLRSIEPLPEYSVEKAFELYSNAATRILMPLEFLIIKMNFDSFIERFEREQTNINVYGNALPYATKVKMIFEELLKYAQEFVSASSPTPGNTQPPDDTTPPGDPAPGDDDPEPDDTVPPGDTGGE